MYRATNLTTDQIVRIICAVQHGHCRLINYWLNSLCLLRLKSILSHQNRLTIRHFLSYANQLCRPLPDLVGPINSMDGISNAHPRCRQKWNVNLVGRTISFVKYRHFFHVRFLLFFFLFFFSLFCNIFFITYRFGACVCCIFFLYRLNYLRAKFYCCCCLAVGCWHNFFFPSVFLSLFTSFRSSI